MSISTPEKLLVIANPGSGQGQALLYRLNKKLRQFGIPWDLRVTHAHGDGARLAKEGVEQGADAIAVFGGDGTVMDVADGLVGTDTPLLILSGGTGNLVAAEVGVPKEIDKALDLLGQPIIHTRKIDVGRVGNQHFLLRIGCGIETGVLHDANPDLKKQFGKFAYVIAGIKALQEIQTAEYRITLDDTRVIEGTGVACAVANAGSVGVGDLTLSPRIDIDDGQLDVVFLRKADIEGIFSLAAMMTGLDGQVPAKSKDRDIQTALDASHLVGRWQARKVCIETDPVLEIQADGDVVGNTPQTAEIIAKALTVIVEPRPDRRKA